jgi:biotin carboxyl carrier protein
MSTKDILYTVVVNDNQEQPIEITREDLENADMIRVSEDSIHILDSHQSHLIHVLKADYSARDFLLRINGKDISVRLRDEVESRIHAMGFDISRNHIKLNLVSSPMPGMVLKILVHEGDTVHEGQPVIVLEAMKMENVLTAPLDGIVSKITVKEKQNVDKNQLLVEIV